MTTAETKTTSTNSRTPRTSLLLNRSPMGTVTSTSPLTSTRISMKGAKRACQWRQRRGPGRSLSKESLRPRPRQGQRSHRQSQNRDKQQELLRHAGPKLRLFDLLLLHRLNVRRSRRLLPEERGWGRDACASPATTTVRLALPVRKALPVWRAPTGTMGRWEAPAKTLPTFPQPPKRSPARHARLASQENPVKLVDQALGA